MKPDAYVTLIRDRFAEAGESRVAEGQMAYMRHRYAYYGLKAPTWVAILREVFAEHGLYNGRDLKTFAKLCFREEYHEMFYAGLQMIEKQIKTQPPGFIAFLEQAIIAGGWWDTVDWTCKLAGIHFRRYPDLQRPWAEKWIASDSIWLQRAAMIHQLLLKEQTDEDLLFEMILYRKDSREFFVQKGAGWALRQHSKIRPKQVLRFLDNHPEFSPLTRREGLRWLKKNDNS